MKPVFVLIYLIALIIVPNVYADDVFLSENEEEVLISSEVLSEKYIRIADSEAKHATSLSSDLVKTPLKKLPYQYEVTVAAKATGLEPALIHAIIKVESGYRPLARSAKGAVGLMQLMPEIAQKYKAERTNPQQNILAGARYLRDLLGTFKQNLPLALAAYNAGPQAVIKHQSKIPPFAETQRYVPKVLSLYNRCLKESSTGLNKDPAPGAYVNCQS